MRFRSPEGISRYGDDARSRENSQRAIMPGARSITSDCEAEARGARSK